MAVHTLAQKESQPHGGAAFNVTKSGIAALAADHKMHPFLGLQRTTGNQAGPRSLQTDVKYSETVSETAASPRNNHDFSRIPICNEMPTKVQTKLAVSAPGDTYEQEADRVADSVMAGHSPHIGHLPPGAQHKLYRMVLRPEDMADSNPIEEAEAGPSETSPSEEVQRSATSEAAVVQPQLEPSLQQATHHGWEAMPAPTRSFMESRFGWDFSSVRVHSDTEADTIAQGLNARAFTLGNDIFFAKSQYKPESLEGQHLLAHELTHVVQQSEGRVSPKIQRLTSCSSYNGYNTSANLLTYNCAGLATRTYQNIHPASAVYNAISANFNNPQSAAQCAAGKVKFWLWEYTIHLEDDQGQTWPNWGQPHDDFHVVAGQVDIMGNDPTDVYSKNGHRRVYGPGTGPGFRPPARDRALSNDPNETPGDAPNGRPAYKVRTNMSEWISCAGCYPFP